MSPAERKIYDFGRDFVDRARFNKIFARRSGTMESEIDKISELIDNASKEGNYLRTKAVLKPLMGYFTLARHAHEVTTNALLEFEKITGFSSVDRRKNLLDWNMGARILAKEMRRVLSLNRTPRMLFEIELEALDCARAQIFSPADDRAGAYGQTSEINQLEAATSVQEFRDLRNTPSCTLLTRICCRLEIARLSVDDDPGFRILETWTVTKALEEFRDEFQRFVLVIPGSYGKEAHKTGKCPDSWRPFVDSWIQKAVDVRNELMNAGS